MVSTGEGEEHVVDFCEHGEESMDWIKVRKLFFNYSDTSANEDTSFRNHIR